MAILSFKKGSFVIHNGKEYEIEKAYDIAHVLARDTQDGTVVSLPISELTSTGEKNKPALQKKIEQADLVPSYLWDKAKFKRSVVEDLVYKPDRTKKDIEERGFSGLLSVKQYLDTETEKEGLK